MEKKGEILDAHPDFLLVISYTRGIRSEGSENKHAPTICAIEFDYQPEDEASIITYEVGSSRSWLSGWHC